jgi:signal transduction histidine kinase/CheY-like chemotaxis protein
LQRAILNSANFSIIATDRRGVIQLFNVGAECMLGYGADTVVNKVTPSDLHDPAEVLARAQELSAEFGVAIAPGFEALAFKASRGIEDVYELTYIRADGTRFPAIVSITALLDDYREIIGYLLIGSHNSVRKRVEHELNGAISAADQANLAKSEFLSNMSHELRTPLNAILGFAQLIESGTPTPSPGQMKSVAQIIKAGWYLLDLINEILDLTLIESGKMSLSIEPIMLSDVLRESRSMIESQAIRRGINVVFPTADVPFFVSADRMRLKQVLINLLSNAIKYNREGGRVVVDCSLTAVGKIRIAVTDTGQGLSTEHLSQLFQPFNRLGQEAHVGEGTGIGLVVSKRLVELMGGVIGVVSTVGAGSTFWIDLKLTTAINHHEILIDSTVALPAHHIGESRLRTLLCVEDNPDNLLLVEELIGRCPDIRLISARDGQSGIDLARSTLPDAILMDINLPGISGVEALRILALDSSTASIPIIALSANAGPRDIARGLEAGFFRYLTKPIKVKEFISAIDLAFASVGAPASRVGAEEPIL